MGRHSAIAYLGDDQTDEDAFEALHGQGLSVLVRSQYRPTLSVGRNNRGNVSMSANLRVMGIRPRSRHHF